ncbi:aminotransferase class IV family protein [Rhizobium sp. L1K21]|nr:aminotransferase class IV family protein [Rhizobium sp. L1K21]
MRFVPREGVCRLDEHLQRLESSAFALGFEGADAAATVLEAYLSELTVLDDGKVWRVRLELNRDGNLTCTSSPFALQKPDAIWRVALAKTRIDSGNLLLRHKTTRRAVYEAARAEFPVEAADEVILLNEQGEVAEGTITNIFVEDGAGLLLTPPLECGCLAGVLRQSLIETGRAVERRVNVQDVAAGPFYVGNSLRGLIRAQLYS